MNQSLRKGVHIRIGTPAESVIPADEGGVVLQLCGEISVRAGGCGCIPVTCR